MKEDKKIQEEVNNLIYNKEMLIRQIAEECGKKFANVRPDKEDWQLERFRDNEELSIVRGIYNIFEDIITKILSTTSPTNYITLKLFEGISIDSEFIPEKEKVNNLTGKKITTTNKIKAKANITRNYCEKLYAYSKEEK